MFLSYLFFTGKVKSVSDYLLNVFNFHFFWGKKNLNLSFELFLVILPLESAWYVSLTMLENTSSSPFSVDYQTAFWTGNLLK